MTAPTACLSTFSETDCRGWCAAIVIAIAAIAPRASWAQSIQPKDGGSGWIVLSMAHVDLWYHGLAILGNGEPDLIPRYKPTYGGRIAAEKEERGIGPTLLDERRESLAKDVAENDRDGFIEFVPLYFETATLTDMLSALKSVSRRNADQVPAGTKRGTEITKGILSRSSEQHMLGHFVEALEDEWSAFYESYWDAATSERWEQLQRTQAALDQTLVPALAPVLRQHGFQNGLLVVSDAVGLEGRVALRGGSPIVVVGLPEEPLPPEYAAFSWLRELCYLMLEETAQAIEGSQQQQDQIRQNITVLCGETLLERAVPDAVSEYRRMFAVPFGGGTPSEDEFAKLYRVPSYVYDAMLDEVRRFWR